MEEQYNGFVVDDAISFTLISIGAFFCLLTIIMILANLRQMMTKVWGRLLLLIQIEYLMCCLLDYPTYSTDGNDCKWTSAFFYSFFLVMLSCSVDGQPQYVPHDVDSLHEAQF